MVSKLPAFFAAYPDMAVETAASESPTTIIEDGFDLAIHSGDLPDSTLVARRFAQTMIILVATPQYLGVLEHLGMAQAPAWLFAAELSEGTVIRLLTAFERTVPILPYGLPAAGCPPKFAFSSSTWRKLSRSVLRSTRDSRYSMCQ
jgi:hypothetical protein